VKGAPTCEKVARRKNGLEKKRRGKESRLAYIEEKAAPNLGSVSGKTVGNQE